MSDVDNQMDESSTSRPAPSRWRIFAGAVALCGVFGGFFAAAQFAHLVGLSRYLRDTGAAVWGEWFPFEMLLIIVVVVATPRTWRQLGRQLALCVPLAIWFTLSEDLAVLAQHAIARDGSLFIFVSAFSMLALPPFAAVWAALESVGTPKVADDDDPGWRIGVVPSVVTVLPGVLAATLLTDVLRAFTWLPADPEMAIAVTMPHVALAGIGAMIRARPRDSAQATVLGGALAAAMIAAVMIGVGMEASIGPIDTRDPGMLLPHLASVAIAFFVGWAVRVPARRLAGRDSPWQATGPSIGGGAG